jgi:hypothetical protein
MVSAGWVRREDIDGLGEVDMIRRNVFAQKDHSIRWSLIAAALALSLGFYAEHALATDESAAATAAIEQEAPAPITETASS